MTHGTHIVQYGRCLTNKSRRYNAAKKASTGMQATTENEKLDCLRSSTGMQPKMRRNVNEVSEVGRARFPR